MAIAAAKLENADADTCRYTCCCCCSCPKNAHSTTFSYVYLLESKSPNEAIQMVRRYCGAAVILNKTHEINRQMP